MPTYDDYASLSHRRYRRDGFTLPGAEKHYPPDLELEPVHLDIDMHIDPARESCFGTATTTLQARRNGITNLTLHGVAFEEVSVVDPDGHAVEWRYDGRRFEIEWADEFTAGERRRIGVTYRVTQPASGLYFSPQRETIPDAALWAATDNETERARHWLACVDLPNARPKLDFHLRADERYTILANGELVGEQSNGDGTKTAHWRLDFPCPSYLTCLVVGELVRADDGEVDGKPIAYFATAPFTAEDLRRSFGRTREMLSWMVDKLGMEFPFPKYFQFALPFLGGAMENISLTSWDDIFVMDETLSLEWTRLVDEINVHEMAHSYFGDAVVCRDYAHAWLKESWATYIEQVWFEDSAGDDERAYQYFRDATAYMEEADTSYKRPIVTREFNSSWDMYDRHLYPGGACRLHTLRCELGDEPFWTGVTDYLRRYTGRVVETDDFRRIMEEHSGRSLGRFFDQWFHSKGYPAIKVGFSYDSKRKEGKFEIEQTQVDAEAGVPVFELRTDVGWVIDGQSHSAPVKLTQAKQTVTVPLAKDPEQVRFDPFGKVLHSLEFKPGDKKLRSQLESAPDVIGRILAGRELAASGRRRNIEAVRAAYVAEPFWGVRIEHAKSLAKAASESAVDALFELVQSEQDPLVLASLIRSAGTYRDRRVAEAISERLEAGLPYWATGAAYQALGAQREEAPYELLLEAAQRETFSGIAQSGALRGLAASQRDEALDVLLEATRPGSVPDRARGAAVGALAELGQLQDKKERVRAVERLVDLLRDRNLRIRSQALAGLGTMRAKEAVEALEGYRAPLSVQEQVRVDRVKAKINRGQEPKLAALEKQVEKLQADLRKLGDRLEEMEARVKPDASGEDGGSADS